LQCKGAREAAAWAAASAAWAATWPTTWTAPVQGAERGGWWLRTVLFYIIGVLDVYLYWLDALCPPVGELLGRSDAVRLRR